MRSFSNGYTCDARVKELYETVEPKVLPMLKRKSHNVSSRIPGIDYEDALQEGKIAVLSALSKYDPAKSTTGGWEPYVGKVISNAYRGMMYEALMKSKVPHVVNEEGESRPKFPLSLDSLSFDGNSSACEPLTPARQENDAMWAQVKTDISRFTMKMYNKLEGVELPIFKCMVHPKQDFLEMMFLDGVAGVRKVGDALAIEEGMQVPSASIRKYLGISKNVLDWAMYKIKYAFMKMAKFDEDFSDVFDGMLDGRRWPQVHVKPRSENDIDWKKRVFASRALDTAQIGPSEKYSIQPVKPNQPKYSRTVKWYKWGAVVEVRRNRERFLMILEGRFNVNTGAVFGESGARLNVPMDWYPTLARQINAKR